MADEDVGLAEVVEGLAGGCAFEDRVQVDQQDVADLVRRAWPRLARFGP
jgi:hypothetical protein